LTQLVGRDLKDHCLIIKAGPSGNYSYWLFSSKKIAEEFAKNEKRGMIGLELRNYILLSLHQSPEQRNTPYYVLDTHSCLVKFSYAENLEGMRIEAPPRDWENLARAYKKWYNFSQRLAP